jgi:hypothetical protein
MIVINTSAGGCYHVCQALSCYLLSSGRAVDALGGMQASTVLDDYDYNDAVAASVEFYAAQRSGPLGSNYSIAWRGDSGLTDSPVGGYYLGTSALYARKHIPSLLHLTIPWQKDAAAVC